MIETQESYNNIESSANKISLTDLLNMILSNWYWFIISVIFCGSIALLYLNYKAPIYQRTATVLVKDSRKGSGTEVTAFNDIIGGLGRRSVDNEVHIFKSRRIMEQVVLKHDLTTRYSTKHGIRTIDLYGRTPLIVKFINVDPAEVISFKYKIDGDNIYFSDFLNIEGLKITAKVGDTITTPLCDITTIATPYFDKNSNLSVMVNKMPLNEVVESYRKRLKCDIIDKQASVITISMVDQVPLRAEHVINGVIDAYNVDAIEDKQAISNLTEEFISERLATLGKELNIADSDIATFKQDNHLFSLKEEATLGAEEIKRLKKDKLALEVNLEMAEYILNYLHDTRNERALIPASTITMSGASSALEKHVELYNTNVLNYQRLLNASSETNPIIVDLGNQISNVRNTIISSLESHIEGLKLHIEQLTNEQNVADRRMQSSPNMEKEFLSKARQQKVKEELYIYLLTKLEENALMGATAESNARIIDRAYGSNRHVSPNSLMILFIAFVMGIFIPLAIIYIREIMDTMVRSRRDLDDALSIPYLGDIPLYEGNKGNGIIVREDSRDALSESFRMIRTNLGFMSVDKTIQVIMFTSSIPHSGKTFASSNLAMTLAASGKRVIVVDFDLRRRTFSKTLGHRNDRRGVTSYLTNKITSLNDIISNSGLDENLDFIYAGPQPPNPAEMLLSQRVDDFIAELRTRYDYIILDSVPAMAVADAMIIDRLVDLTVYVIRQGNLDRRHLPDIEQLYREKKFRNMCVILNGVTTSRRT
ncbi:MAG: polysaccharide biosynthesis tyrosine autokinase, partial [Alistipes sp.]|nr:polysaccharide biosynthesis tyrosine autokinase [Alistipes sp.]